jgi:hypothetical protein
VVVAVGSCRTDPNVIRRCTAGPLASSENRDRFEIPPVEALAFKSEQLVAQRVLCAVDLSCDVEQPLSTIRVR